ncbi:MAG TPA: ParB-like protein, partial [Moraxellaceae bacterium]
PNGKIYAMVQSTLDVPDASAKSVKDKALFTRIVEIDRTNEAAPTTRTLAYPLNPADWQDGKSGKAKLGDLVAVDNTHFLIIEQGAFKDNLIHNKIFLVDIADASDISDKKNGELELETVITNAGLINAGVKTAKKTLVGDLRDYGWLLEKTEGLALIDNQTIALINDDDFGLGVDARDPDGNAVDATKLYVDTATGAVSDGSTSKVYSYKVAGNAPSQRRTQLWLIKLAKPVLEFQQDYSYAQAGDLLQAPLKDFHPTQPAIGYDQIYYKLGRYTMGKDSSNKKFDDYCEDMGQKKANTFTASPVLSNPASFTCKDALGTTPASMKSAVIGPQGKLYLTDGHHSFTSYWETSDGGENMKVWVRVLANFSNARSMDDFWAKMKANNYVWLKDGSNNNAAITPEQLPAKLGLGNGLHNDPYRSLIYFTRDIGYSQPAGATEFLEFYWGDWMRAQGSAITLPTGSTDLSGYLAAVQTASNAMVAITAGSVVSGGKTTADLGKLDAFGGSKFTDLSVPYSESSPGKLAYALQYRNSLTAP